MGRAGCILLPRPATGVTAARWRRKSCARALRDRSPRTARAPTVMAIFHAVCVLLAAVTAGATPGRVPKVYNALITSGQNLAPSKAFPVYQPVLHETPFGFPYQPTFFYGEDFKNIYAAVPPEKTNPAESSKSEESAPKTAPEVTQPQEKSGEIAGDDKKDESSTIPPPPATKSPIPLNEFGLPPAVLPLGHLEPPRPAFSYDPFAPFSPYYPDFRLYNPYSDFYGFPSYPLLPPLYGGHPSLLEPAEGPSDSPTPPAPSAQAGPAAPAGSPTPPPAPAPGELDINNYSGKDHSIPDVPAPPLPKTGFKN